MRFQFDLPAFPPGAHALRARVRAFIAEELAAGRFEPRPNSWMAYDEAFSRRCGEAGFLGLTLPPEYGGHGRSVLERYVVYEEMLAAGAPVGKHWIGDRQSGPQIARFGSEAARRRLIPGITRGELCFGIGMSEPDAGSDLAAVRTRAVRVEGGWRITGNKLWTSHAHRADYTIVLARTAPATKEDRRAGLTQFLVDMREKGAVARPIEDLTGGRDFNEVSFEEVFVGDDFVLGEPGSGWELVNAELALERSGPDRFLSTFALLVDLVQSVAADSAAAERTSRREVGRVIAHLATLRRMSMGVAGMLDRQAAASVSAAIVKDLGTHFEREVGEAARRSLGAQPRRSHGDRIGQRLATATLAGPSFMLRGGTREILRGIIARELGLR